jgi:hypothetical protein
MKSSTFYCVLTIGVLLMGAVAWWGVHQVQNQPKPQASAANPYSTATNTPSLAGLSIYTNGQYGFSIFYPSSLKTTTTFDMTYHLSANWRVNALTNATGTPIIEILGYQTRSDVSFPRYFQTEARVGASADPREVAVCTQAGNGERALPAKVINGTSWQAFTFQNAGMMQYVSAISYRTVHDHLCYAIEQIETGASYRDAPSPSDIPQSILDQHFQELSSIVNSFTFARP